MVSFDDPVAVVKDKDSAAMLLTLEDFINSNNINGWSW
jgi:hypothetical protein